jgi:hypothetical protein
MRWIDYCPGGRRPHRRDLGRAVWSRYTARYSAQPRRPRAGRIREEKKSMSLREMFPMAAPVPTSGTGDRAELAWYALLLAAAVGSSFTFACVTPFAAFAVLTAGTLPLGRAFGMTLVIWAANQLLGYGALGYPLDGLSFAWGLTIGLAALAATLAAVASFWIMRRRALWRRIPAAFIAAFALYEIVLVLASLMLSGSENFAPIIVAKLALSDAGWLVGLGILRHWLVSFGLVPARVVLS